MFCRRDNCNNEIPRPTPRNAPNGYCSYECELIAKQAQEDTLETCKCGGEAVTEHEGSKYFVCCSENCGRQTKETFLEASDAEEAWNNNEIEQI